MLSDRRMGMPVRRAGYRNSVLPCAHRLGSSREGIERSRNNARDHDVPSSRGWARVQLRVQAIQHARMETTLWSVSTTVPRQLSSNPIFAKLRSTPRGMVRTKTSRRRLRGNFCCLATPDHGWRKRYRGWGAMEKFDTWIGSHENLAMSTRFDVAAEQICNG